MRAVICGYYGKGNGGDEALLMSLLQMLPEQFKPLVLSGNPRQTEQRYQVESCDRFSSWHVLQALRQSDCFIWGGGSLIQDVTSRLSPLYYLGLMALAQKLGLKTIAWAQGIGPLQSPLTRVLTKKALSHCNAISVRDQRSAQLLAEWEIPSLFAPDPVWALTPQPMLGLWDLPAPRIAVSLRPSPQLTRERLNILTQALVSLQTATQAYMLLVAFQPEQDLAIARAVAAHLQPSHKIICLENPAELTGLFRGVEMTIGMRYHSLIMAASQECRCFALSYDPKVSQLQSELNLPGWELSQLPLDPNLISTSWLQEYVNGEALTKTQIQGLIDRALLHTEIFQKII